MTVEIVNALKKQAQERHQIFYRFYSEEEIKRDPTKANTGLFFFKGRPGEKFAIENAGGGFVYEAAMHDSFPHALTLSKKGYNGFALIYRVDDPINDLARAIFFIEQHAKELEVDPSNYSLWDGSAGARMAAYLSNKSVLGQVDPS